MTNSDYLNLGKMLVVKHPELAEKLLESEQPVMTDFELIEKVKSAYDYLAVAAPESSQALTDYRLVLIAVIVRLYDPSVLTGTKQKLRSGLRKQISLTLDISPTHASHLFRMAKDHMSLYKPFRREIESLFAEAYHQYYGFQESAPPYFQTKSN